MAPNGHHNGAAVEQTTSARERALERDLEVANVRTDVAIGVSQHVFQYLHGDHGKVVAIVDDVLDRWLNRTGDKAQPLTGPQGFIESYLGDVEFVHEWNGHEEHRQEHCSPEGKPSDESAYFTRVWADHVRRLMAHR